MKQWFSKQAEKARETTEKIKHKTTQQTRTKAFNGAGQALGSAEENKGQTTAATDRREQQLRAAQAREKAWDSKVAKGRQNRRAEAMARNLIELDDEASVVPPPAPLPTNLASFEQAKAAEAAAIKQSTGFNP